MNIVVMGPQGSGKTTQAELLAKKLSVPFISTGAITRAIAKEKTARGKHFRQLEEAGILLSDTDVLAILKQRLQKEDCAKGFVLDGAPRTLSQAEKLDGVSNTLAPFQDLEGFLGKIGKKLDKVFYIKLSDETGIERLAKRGRVDDTPEAIKKRLSFYHRETEPVLQFYRGKGILQEIDGEKTIEEIQKEIAKNLQLC